ncbi:MAG: hypothetical protein IH847_03845 [Acidobacteria bacterium]|nr:hypothetical protein [Acidobacteriota bacterium]
MDSPVRRLMEFLEADIRNWEEAARFCEQQVTSVKNNLSERSGKEQGQIYRERVREYRALLEELKKETGKA